MKISLRFCLPLLALAPFVALAQPRKVAIAPAQSANGGTVTITNALDGKSIYDDAQGTARITKDVIITQSGENLTLYAQEVDYNRVLNRARASGKLRVGTRNSTIKGQRIVADFNDRRFTISGSVLISSYGKKDAPLPGINDEEKHKPVQVKCDQVVWDYDTRQAKATGNIKIFQGTSHGECNSIIYDEPHNIIRLQGDVKFADAQNRTVSGQNVLIHIDQNTVSSNTRTHMVFNQLDDGKTPRAAKTPVPFAPAPRLPANLFDDPTAAPAPRPTATEEPVPTPLPDEPEPAADAPTAPAPATP